ncbi:transmembrane protein 144-like isoform X2 [Lineus longissimus]|uniref:transmembrane protein 144-like isoform X2 n=1 Tax=Lineus longissimus TaxID=88925 RepID=UPI002B4C9129
MSFILDDNGMGMDAATTAFPNMTTAAPTEAPFPTYVGFIAAGISCFFFGSNFAPIKTFETGDGMFFQWVMTTAVWNVGLIVNAVQGFPTFYPLAMLGGFLWATGNICVVTIVKTIGLSLGLLIWASFNLISGWASGRFGWFGIKPEVPNNLAFNYAGVGLAALRAVIFLFIKSTPNGQDRMSSYPAIHSDDGQRRYLLFASNKTPTRRRGSLTGSGSHTVSSQSTVQISGGDDDTNGETFIDRLSPLQRRILGTVLAAISGVFYGLCFTPVIYVQDNYPGASKDGLDYVFAHFCGIYATSVFYFFVYCIIMKNKPRVYPKAILPGIVSGAMWGVAQTGWFIANETLSEPVSFPIITTGPALIASLWGVFVFKEIQGCRNLVILVIAFCVTISGALLSAFSKM